MEEPLFAVLNEDGEESEDIVREAARRHWEIYRALTSKVTIPPVVPASPPPLDVPETDTAIVQQTIPPLHVKQEHVENINPWLDSQQEPRSSSNVVNVRQELPPAEAIPAEFSFPIVKLSTGSSRFRRHSILGSPPNSLKKHHAKKPAANSFFARALQVPAPPVRRLSVPAPPAKLVSLPAFSQPPAKAEPVVKTVVKAEFVEAVCAEPAVDEDEGLPPSPAHSSGESDRVTPARSDCSAASSSSSSGLSSLEEARGVDTGRRGAAFRGMTYSRVSDSTSELTTYSRQQYEQDKRAMAEVEGIRQLELTKLALEERVASLRRQAELEQKRLDRSRSQMPKPIPPPPRSKTQMMTAPLTSFVTSASVAAAQKARISTPGQEHSAACCCGVCWSRKLLATVNVMNAARATAVVASSPAAAVVTSTAARVPLNTASMSAAEAARRYQADRERLQNGGGGTRKPPPPPPVSARRRTDVAPKRKVAETDGYQSDEF